jgi:hypothetical protein
MLEEDKPWKDLDYVIAEEAEEMFQSCIKCKVGNGERLQFWTNMWINGRSVEQLAPNLMPFVALVAKVMTVVEVLHADSWIAAIRGRHRCWQYRSSP